MWCSKGGVWILGEKMKWRKVRSVEWVMHGFIKYLWSRNIWSRKKIFFCMCMWKWKGSGLHRGWGNQKHWWRKSVEEVEMKRWWWVKSGRKVSRNKNQIFLSKVRSLILLLFSYYSRFILGWKSHGTIKTGDSPVNLWFDPWLEHFLDSCMIS